MKSITIKGSKRESVGKSATKALRNAEMVPCVIYGGDQSVHFYATEKSFEKLVFTPNVYKAAIELGDKEYSTMLQDIQFHPVTDRILHIDFYQLFDHKKVTMTVPVKLTGNSIGVLNGGSLHFTNRKLKIRALPPNLPDFIGADISELKIGDKLFITELFNDDYTFMHPNNTVVVQVKTSRNAQKDEDEGEETVVE